MADVPAQPADAIAAIDLCVVPTLTFECLFAFLVVGHGRRQQLWFAVTRHPTAEWLAQQIVETFPWGTAPTYLVRDNDGAYGWAFMNRVRAMGIRDHPISPRSPWQNPYVERLIGTLRRECLDHVLICGERHLRRILTLYSLYYNETRTHLGLGKDAPLRRSVQRSGTIVVTLILCGLHHQSCADCIIATGGYDFREGQPFLPRICNAERKNIPSQRRRCLAGKLPLTEYARSARDNYHANVMSTFECTEGAHAVPP
jgi:hypothetical protein